MYVNVFVVVEYTRPYKGTFRMVTVCRALRSHLILSRFAIILSRFAIILSRFAIIVSRFAIILSRFAIILLRFAIILSRFAISFYFVALCDYFVALCDLILFSNCAKKSIERRTYKLFAYCSSFLPPLFGLTDDTRSTLGKKLPSYIRFVGKNDIMIYSICKHTHLISTKF
jgi:hypothetical protein